MIDDLVHKGHMKLNIFHFLVNQLGAYVVSSQSLTFKTDYSQKLHFNAFLDGNIHIIDS